MTRRKDPQPDTVAEPVQSDLVQPELVQPETAQPDVAQPDLDQSVSAADVPAEPPASDLDATSRPPPPPRRSGVLGPLLGGALAAIGGFGLSHFNVFGLAAPDISPDLAALGARVEEAATQQTGLVDKINAELAALADRIATLQSLPAPAAPDLSRLDALDERLSIIEAMPADGTGTNAALTAKVAELDRRLSALPATGPSPDLQNQLDEALARLDAAEAAATAKTAEAEAAVAAANRAQALDAVSALVADGRPFASELQALADPALTTALGPMAETGVPTLASLQAGFPDASREALRIAREISAEDGWSDRLVDFLASQTGARSVTPREGTTPDAILSRAEFALSEARIGDALAELEPLDPAVKAPLDPWIAEAKAHLAATAALNAARGE